MFPLTATPEPQSALLDDTDRRLALNGVTDPIMQEAYRHKGVAIDLDDRKLAFDTIVKCLNIANRSNGFIMQTSDDANPNPNIHRHYGAKLGQVQERSIHKRDRFLRAAEYSFKAIQSENNLINAGFDRQKVADASRTDWERLMAKYGPGNSHKEGRQTLLSSLATRASIKKAHEKSLKTKVKSK